MEEPTLGDGKIRLPHTAAGRGDLAHLLVGVEGKLAFGRQDGVAPSGQCRPLIGSRAEYGPDIAAVLCVSGPLDVSADLVNLASHAASLAPAGTRDAAGTGF